MPLLKQVVEALVFASQKPLVPREIAAALKGAAEDSEDPAIVALGKTKEAEIGVRAGRDQDGDRAQTAPSASSSRSMAGIL